MLWSARKERREVMNTDNPLIPPHSCESYSCRAYIDVGAAMPELYYVGTLYLGVTNRQSHIRATAQKAALPAIDGRHSAGSSIA